MIYLLYGPEAFLKKQYLSELVAKTGSQLEYHENIEPDRLKELLEPTLFGVPQILVLEDYLDRIDSGTLEFIKDSPKLVTLLENKLDKRKKEAKALLADKKIVSQEFLTPTGDELRKFLTERIKLYPAERFIGRSGP